MSKRNDKKIKESLNYLLHSFMDQLLNGSIIAKHYIHNIIAFMDSSIN